jgi:hypothetical protein
MRDKTKNLEITYVKESEYQRTALVDEGGRITDSQCNGTLHKRA